MELDHEAAARAEKIAATRNLIQDLTDQFGAPSLAGRFRGDDAMLERMARELGASPTRQAAVTWLADMERKHPDKFEKRYVAPPLDSAEAKLAHANRQGSKRESVQTVAKLALLTTDERAELAKMTTAEQRLEFENRRILQSRNT